MQGIQVPSQITREPSPQPKFGTPCLSIHPTRWKFHDPIPLQPRLYCQLQADLESAVALNRQVPEHTDSVQLKAVRRIMSREACKTMERDPGKARKPPFEPRSPNEMPAR